MSYWSKPLSPLAKKMLLAVLVLCFLVQTIIVYSDQPMPEPLSERAMEGRSIWHRENCQACHQLFGFGGFLGPDLTNAAERVDPGRLTRLLTSGSDLMPAFELPLREINSVRAFLNEINETGRGQLRFETKAEHDTRGNRLLTAIGDELADAPDELASAGFGLFIERKCQECHLPTGQTAVKGPNLFGVTKKLSNRQIEDVLRNGRLPGMPAPELSDGERATVRAFLGWLTEHEGSIVARARELLETDDGFWDRLPWWEYD